jgi:hypothetical protein
VTRSGQRIKKFAAIEQKILKQVPGCLVSADPAYREADLAIDFSEDVQALPQSDINQIVEFFEQEWYNLKNVA